MPGWMALVLSVCALGITIALVLVLLSARRTLDRVEALLAVAEREIDPLALEARGLTADARALTQETTRELRRTGEVIDQVHDAAAGMTRVVTAMANLTRAGQIVGLASALRRGVDVFVERLRKDGGNHHGQ